MEGSQAKQHKESPDESLLIIERSINNLKEKYQEYNTAYRLWSWLSISTTVLPILIIAIAIAILPNSWLLIGLLTIVVGAITAFIPFSIREQTTNVKANLDSTREQLIRLETFHQAFDHASKTSESESQKQLNEDILKDAFLSQILTSEGQGVPEPNSSSPLKSSEPPPSLNE
jgi:glucan phosphoethanolaminetransferase (alkaline phosphatase superfamily)